MFARLARYSVDPERCSEALEAFDEAAAQIGDLDGLEHAFVLADAESGRIVTMTLWRDRAAMEASEVRASRLRQEAVRDVEGSVDSVERLDVASEVGDYVDAPRRQA